MTDSSSRMTVYYDGSCPLCQKEIRHYRKLKKADSVDWVDISSVPEGSLPQDLDRKTAMKKFHVRTETGELVSGAKAFLTVWQIVPFVRGLAKLRNNRLFVGLLDRLYILFLKVRPCLQKWAGSATKIQSDSQ